MRFLFFLGPLCEGAPPAGGGGENLFPGDYDYIRQGRGHNVCLAVSPQGIACQNIYGYGYFPVCGDWRSDCTLGDFHHADYGFDYYAPQSFVDGGTGRRLQIGWMGMPDADYGNPATVAYGWQHCMTLPRVLTHDGQGHILQNPASELTACRGAAVALPDGAEQAVDVCFDLTAAPAGDFSLAFDGGLTLAYADAARMGL